VPFYHQYLAGSLLAILILVPAFFNGGKNDLMGPVTFALIAILILLTRHRETEQKLPAASWLLLAFLGWTIVDTIFFSRRFYASIVTALPIFSGALIFLTLQISRLDKKTVKTFVYTLIGGGVMLSLYGLFLYLTPGSNLFRLGSTFYQHNAFAGFLIPILILSLHFFRFEPRLKFSFGLSALILTTVLVLTFSRGGFIAAAAAIVIFFIFLGRQTNNRRSLIKSVALTSLILAAGGLLAYGIYGIKTAKLAEVGLRSSITPTSPYAGERPEQDETGVAARLQYWNAAWQLIKGRPIVGSGLGSFGQEYLRVQTDPRFYSSDPHNLYLRMAAELGLIGGLLFIIFIALAIIPRGLSLWRRPEENTLYAPLLAGSIGLLTHYGADIDFTFPAHVLLFFSILGLVAKPESSILNLNIKIKPMLIGASLILLLYSSISFFYNPLNPALADVEKALRLHPYDRDTHLLAGKILAERGDHGRAEKHFRLAITYGPARDLEAYTQLAGLLHGLGRVEEAKTVARAGLTYFPADIFESSLWVNPNKATIKFHRDLLVKYLNI